MSENDKSHQLPGDRPTFVRPVRGCHLRLASLGGYAKSSFFVLTMRPPSAMMLPRQRNGRPRSPPPEALTKSTKGALVHMLPIDGTSTEPRRHHDGVSTALFCR